MCFKFATSAILSVMLASTSVETAPSQSETPAKQKASAQRLSPDELREAIAIANLFIKRFRESRDMGPIIKQMFAKGFDRFIAGDSSWAGLVGLPFPLIENLDQSERVRCYLANFTIEYIMRLYLFGKVPLDTTSNEHTGSILPPEVVKFFESNQVPEVEVKTRDEARRILDIYERTVPFLRDHLISNAPEETDQFKQNLAAFEKHLDDPGNNLGRPVPRTPNREVAGYPAGTRLIALEIPFHIGLILVRESGDLKILFAMSQIPPD